jgi:Holliday junction resolvase RusA-like endonuclease
MLIIEIPGHPLALARPRFFRKGENVGVYDSQKREKEQVQWQMKAQFRNDPFDFPMVIDLTFFMPIPKTTPKGKKKQMICGILHHVKKPDIDNLQKFVLDCMNNIVFKDDSQIIELNSKKIYAENPGTLIVIKSCSDLSQTLV